MNHIFINIVSKKHVCDNYYFHKTHLKAKMSHKIEINLISDVAVFQMIEMKNYV